MLLVIVTISFFIVRSAPGSPFAQERALPPIVIENLEAKYGLDKPIFVQYLNYLKNLLRGDLGDSTAYPDYSVTHYLLRSFPHSLLLGAITIFIALTAGVAIGILAALHSNGWLDYLIMAISVVGLSIPNFVLGPLLIYLFALGLHWLPTSGWIYEGGLRTLILPTITFSLHYLGVFSRLSRSSMIEVISSDYICSARAKGLSTGRIIFRHALPGAIAPVISYLGPAFAGVVTGSIVIESIFRIPGIGLYFVQSALNRDYFLLLGTVIFYSIILVAANTLVDLAYAWLDPRISYERKRS